MPQYLVAVYNQPSSRQRTPEEMAPIFADVSALNEQAMADGIFVFAGGLDDRSTSTTFDPRSGTVVSREGLHLDTEDSLGGFWIIEVPDADAALAWSARAAAACREVVEVRPFMSAPPQAG